MPPPRIWTPPVHLNPVRLTPATGSLLTHAHLVADARGHNSVAGEHVLFSLITSEEQGQWSAGLLMDRLVDQQRLASYVSAVVPAETGTSTAANPPMSEPLVAALLLAADYSEAQARQSVTTADLLIGLLGVQGSIASAILLETGMREAPAVAEGAAAIAANYLARTLAELNGTADTVELPRLLADLDTRDLRSLGGRLLRTASSPQKGSSARRWLTAHESIAADPMMQTGPLMAGHPRTAHAAMRIAYAIGDRGSYFRSLIQLAQIHMKWGRFGQATAMAVAARRLSPKDFDDTDLTLLQDELALYDRRTGIPHGVPQPLAEAFGNTSAQEAWQLLLRFPQLLSPSGLSHAANRLEQSTANHIISLAHLGSWEVARELLFLEQMRDYKNNIAIAMNEGLAETAITRAMNYVVGLPADESRKSADKEKDQKEYSSYEFEPSENVEREFRVTSTIALGQLLAADVQHNTAAYAFQFGKHAQQQVEINKIDLEHLDFAIECFALAVDSTDTSDPLYISRTVALSRALELRFTVTRDIRSIESASERIWEALYSCTPPDSALGRLYFRLSEVTSVPHSTVAQFRETPNELETAGLFDWPAIEPTYDRDLLDVPWAIVQHFEPNRREARRTRLQKELTDDNGSAKQIWAPESRPGEKWNELADLAFDLAVERRQSAEDWDYYTRLCETARKTSIDRATTVADEAEARFGLVELSLAKLAQSEDKEDRYRALLDEIQRCREHDDQLGPARVRRLAEWAAEAFVFLGEIEEAVGQYSSALEIEEKIFGTQSGLRHRILSRSAEPSNVATMLSLLLGPTDPREAIDALERGRALVFRALTDAVETAKVEAFLPACDATPLPLELRGRPISRGSYRSIATMGRMGLKAADTAERQLPPSAMSADIRRSLHERNSNLVYLVAGPDDGGILIVPPAGHANFVKVPAFSGNNLRRSLPTPAPDDDTSFRMDEWFESFHSANGGHLWTLLRENLDSSLPLYLVSCGVAAAFPWAACRQQNDSTVRNLASGSHLVNSVPVAASRPRTCRILSAPLAAGLSPLDYAKVEVQAISERWTLHGNPAHVLSNATVGECLTALASDVDVCHIVSHAAGSEKDPLRQGLALANGFVLTTDILGSTARVNPNLIILSSCHSGQAAFEVPNEFISLSSSLVAKGARGTIGNMWAIDDFTSCVISEVIHDLVLNSTDPAEAVSRVQQAGRSRDAEFFTTTTSLLRSPYLPDDFSIDELFAAGSWAGLQYVGL